MVKWQEGLLYEMKAHMKYYFMADKNGKILWREEPIKEDAKRELEKIYYETHKKVYEKEHRQATGEEIVQAILAKLPELGYVKLGRDVDIDKEEVKYIAEKTKKLLKEMGYVRFVDVEIDEVKAMPVLDIGLRVIGHNIEKANLEVIVRAIYREKPIRVKEGE